MEQVCVLCHRSDADPDSCGPIADYQGISAHFFCLLFASEIHLEGIEQEESMPFLPTYIQCTVEEAAQKDCFVCHESGATIKCQEVGCEHRFHLPCAVQGECITHYIPPNSSYCCEHRPRQREVAPDNTTCLICLDPVDGRTTYRTMVCPVCKHAWFHRACIQRQALNAGMFSLRCPLCRNRNRFLTEMLLMGIQIPVREASWEDNSAYAPLYQRHSSCNARECLCPRGREETEPEGPWQLLLCHSCAAEGTHRRCSNLGNSRERWECDNCAGVGTSSRVSSELAGPSSSTPAASGQTRGPPAQETISPSTSRQLESGPFHGFPAPEHSSRSSRPGPQRRRNQTRCDRQTRTPYTRPTRERERSQAASSTHSQAVPGLSRRPPACETRSRSTTGQQPSASSHGSAAVQRRRLFSAIGPVRVRDRSRLQRRAQTPTMWRKRCRERSHTPAPRAKRLACRRAVSGLPQHSPGRVTSSSSSESQESTLSSCSSQQSGSRSSSSDSRESTLSSCSSQQSGSSSPSSGSQ